MIAARHGREELEPVLQQDDLAAVLIGLCDQKVEIAVAGQHRTNVVAALPVTVCDLLQVKIVKNRQEDWRKGVLRSRSVRLNQFSQDICLSHNRGAPASMVLEINCRDGVIRSGTN